MNYSELVQIFDSSNYLVEKPASFRFFDPLVLNNKIKELTATCILHDQIELLWRLNNFIKLNYVWVPNQL